jgi:acyl-CoA dehydrogenase
MLSDIERAHYNAELALRACARPVGELDLGMVAASRATLYEVLCLAADQVVQVHGGIGYMRDAGAEKILRDMNMLRLQAGGTREIRLFLAGWCGDAQ